MFAAWGRFVFRRRWWVLGVSGLLLAGSALVAAQGGKLESGGLIETSESGQASRLIQHELPRSGGSTFTLVFASDTLDAKSPEFRAAVEEAIAPLRADPRVATIVTPYDGNAPDPTLYVARDARAVAVDVATKDELPVARDYYADLRGKVRSDRLRVQATGLLAITHGFDVVLQDDLRRAETVSLPLALILLLIVFGSVVAALVPLGVGVLAVVGGIAGMFLLNRVTSVSVYAENVVTLIGLGVAIDYSLFITNRFREELRNGLDTEAALAVAMATSGRAITFSGLTVAIGLSGMLFYQGTFLSSMGVAGAIVVASAVLYGLTFLPALLAILGRNVDRLRVPIFQADPSGRGWWHTVATAVMRRPVMVLVPVVAFILLAGSPFLHLRLATGDVAVLPKHEESRAAYDKLRADFAGADLNHMSVVLRYPGGDPLAKDHVPALVDLAKRLRALPDVQYVDDPRLQPADLGTIFLQPRSQLPPQFQALLTQTVGEHIVLLDVATTLAPYSDEARDLVRATRSLETAPGAEK